MELQRFHYSYRRESESTRKVAERSNRDFNRLLFSLTNVLINNNSPIPLSILSVDAMAKAQPRRPRCCCRAFFLDFSRLFLHLAIGAAEIVAASPIIKLPAGVYTSTKYSFRALACSPRGFRARKRNRSRWPRALVGFRFVRLRTKISLSLLVSNFLFDNFSSPCPHA